jgi:hypothetical protein
VAVCWTLAYAGPAAAQETPTAKATRKKLDKKISVEWKDTRMQDAMTDIKNEFDGRLGIKIDNTAGISNNTKVSFKADDQPLKKILDDFCTKYELGYIVLSKKNDRYDGWIIIRKSKERGYEEGKEPKETQKDSSAAPPPPVLTVVAAMREVRAPRLNVP